MKRPIAAITLCFAATAVTPALSADLGVAPTYKAPAMPPAFSWSGFYIGGHLGSAWASDTVVQSTGVTAFSSTKITSAGFAGGVFVGAGPWFHGFHGHGFYGPRYFARRGFEGRFRGDFDRDGFRGRGFARGGEFRGGVHGGFHGHR